MDIDVFYSFLEFSCAQDHYSRAVGLNFVILGSFGFLWVEWVRICFIEHLAVVFSCQVCPRYELKQKKFLLDLVDDRSSCKSKIFYILDFDMCRHLIIVERLLFAIL